MNLCSRCSGELPAFAVFCPHCAQVNEPNFDELIDLTIDGRYRVYRRLGQGGLSTIFAATDLETDSVVAIKISDPAQLVLRAMNFAMDSVRARDYWDEMLERMRREAETLATINHPNIVRFNGTGMINDDLRYVVMEFLRGHTLRDEIDRDGAVEPSKSINIALEVASALLEVHARGIVHRDINPRNIMLADCGLRIADYPNSASDFNDSYDSQSAMEEYTDHNPQSAIKLIDFGIAKFPQPPGAPPFTQHSTLAGTVAYASPEQCASHPVDNRSDIYSLGVVLYEMVTGRRPFTGRTPTEVALKQIQSEPTPPRSINPAISLAVERAILRALAKNPDDRQQYAEELSEELRKSTHEIFIPLAATSLEAEAQYDPNGGTAIYPSPDENEITESDLRLVRRRRRRLAVAASAALVAAIAAAALWGLPSASSRRNPANVSANIVAPSPSSDAAPSKPDSLELAARTSAQNNNTGGASTTGPQATPSSTQQTQPAPDYARQAKAANLAPNTKSIAQTATLPTPSPAPAPIPPRTRPQMPPAPAPDIALKRSQQLASEPDVSQGPVKERDSGRQRRENASAIGDPDPGQNGDIDSESDRAYEYNPPRKRNNDTFNRHRIPDPPNRDREDRDGVNDYQEDSDIVGPKLYQWSGRVNNEREITIELPGVPGTVEIPRAYRDRVGVVEPPSAHNRWSCVVLRIIGRGGFSFVIRWWPSAHRV
ncbi:MAG: protein kinase [Chloracidobacterium sp.]|nr:protein kinase [Chloracidobacterium sp.]